MAGPLQSQASIGPHYPAPIFEEEAYKHDKHVSLLEEEVLDASVFENLRCNLRRKKQKKSSMAVSYKQRQVDQVRTIN